MSGMIIDGNTLHLWRNDDLLSTSPCTDAVGTATLTEFNSPPAVTGFINGARSLDGSTQYFQGNPAAGDIAALQQAGTVEMLISPINSFDGPNGLADIINLTGSSASSASADNTVFNIWLSAEGSISCWWRHGNGQQVQVHTRPRCYAFGVWGLVTVTWGVQPSGRRRCTIYYNGCQVWQETDLILPDGGANAVWTIGKLNGNTTNFYEGLVDEIRISNVERSAADVLDNYQRIMSQNAYGYGVVAPDSNTVARWRLDAPPNATEFRNEVGSPIGAPASSYGHPPDAMVPNTTTGLWQSGAIGRVKRGYWNPSSGSGTNWIVTAASVIEPTTNVLTLSCWVYVVSRVNAYGPIFAKTYRSIASSWSSPFWAVGFVWIQPSYPTGWAFNLSLGGTQHQPVFSGSDGLNIGQWYLLGLVYDGNAGTATAYKNGVAVGSPLTGLSGNVDFSGHGNWLVGDNAGNPSTEVSGGLVVEDCRVETVARSGSYMAALYAGGPPIPPDSGGQLLNNLNSTTYSNNQIILTFDRALLSTAATVNASNYTITPPASTPNISISSISVTGTQVILNTTGDTLTGGSYGLAILANTVFGTDGSTNLAISTTFTGSSTALHVSSVKALTSAEIQVTFSKAVRQVSASNSDDALHPANYSVPGLTIYGVISVNPTTVILLNTPPQTPLTSYNLTVSNIKDIVGNVVS